MVRRGRRGGGRSSRGARSGPYTTRRGRPAAPAAVPSVFPPGGVYIFRYSQYLRLATPTGTAGGGPFSGGIRRRCPIYRSGGPWRIYPRRNYPRGLGGSRILGRCGHFICSWQRRSPSRVTVRVVVTAVGLVHPGTVCPAGGSTNDAPPGVSPRRRCWYECTLVDCIFCPLLVLY